VRGGKGAGGSGAGGVTGWITGGGGEDTVAGVRLRPDRCVAACCCCGCERGGTGCTGGGGAGRGTFGWYGWDGYCGGGACRGGA